MSELLRLLKIAAMDEPDVACLTEATPTRGLSLKESISAAEEVPGPIFNAVSAVAREHSMYVVLPLVEKKGLRFYNSVVLIDRNGEAVGRYHKIHPTIEEIEGGISPGTEQKAFETDFGRIGFAICYDLNFDDVIEALTRDRVDLVFFPSAYPGGLQLKIWAHKYGVYVVSARMGVGSMIVNPLGRVLAKSDEYSPIICKTLNLDYEILHLDYNHPKIEQMKRKYGSKVEVDVSRPEAVFLLASNMRDVTVRDLIREFQLETRKDYFDRATKAREAALSD